MHRMKQRFHAIIKPEPNGWFVGWVEEIPGAITQARSLDECRENLRDSLELMLQTYRAEARMALGPNCIQESLEIDDREPETSWSRPALGVG
jgi:predicted RNase H-like HicB family nuclease